ncbi:hypothetical protein SDC9_123856 [bioreactor metagenome]|uniref:Uncharacterized protein n=1 Tax=bioreactor metagenome TaxID=1076179 RepID=A0A645CIS6_9ZZZZ|nr:hypothetical protein [Rikenellaceae bacterium]
MIRYLLLLFMLSVASVNTYAQDKDDYFLYRENASDLINLLRGASPLVYGFGFTGTYYAYSETFEDGNVVYNGKLYKDVRLNLNSHLDELYVIDNHIGKVVILNKDFVSEFRIGDRLFVNINQYASNLSEDAPSYSLESGYYQLLWEGDGVRMLKKIRKIYEEKINQSLSTSSKNQIERIFFPTTQYYMLSEDKMVQIRRLSDIWRFYELPRSSVRKFVRGNIFDVRNNRDNSYNALLQYINSTLLSR